MSDALADRRLSALRARIEARLEALAPGPGDAAPLLAEAVRYALLAPAKRLRPLLSLLAAEQFGAPGGGSAALDAGCAVEMVHAASLILDDLPCMDDAALRRGRPACHRRFGEDVAVLAAVALLNHAYAVLARVDGPAELRVALVTRLADAVGFAGLVTGQTRDLRERQGVSDLAPLHGLNHQKTGVLFVAAVEAGALAAGAQGAPLIAARAFAAQLGEAFQILDDLVDFAGDLERAGKDVGQDSGKPTVVSLIGPEAARAEARVRLDRALVHLAEVGPGPLPGFVEALFGPSLAAA